MPVTRTTFTKRQKERARQERQAEKAQKKQERKLEKENTVPSSQGAAKITYDEEGNPVALDFHDFE